MIQRLTVSTGDAEFELREIREALETEQKAEATAFFSSGHRKVILLAFTIAAFNEFSGIKAVLYYAPTIFESAGASQDSAFLQAVNWVFISEIFPNVSAAAASHWAASPTGYLQRSCRGRFRPWPALWVAA